MHSNYQVPNTVTATAPNSSSNGIPNVSSLALLDNLYEEQVQWSNTLYRSAQDKLIDLLARCMEVHILLANDDHQRKAFSIHMKNKGLALRDGTDLSTRIVRYVFRLEGGRMHAYSRVIREALSHQISPADLGAWLASKGGIEGVRNRQVTNGRKTALLDDAASALESATPLLNVRKLSPSMQPDSNSYGNFTLLLVRHNKSTGDGEVVWGSSNSVLVKNFIGRHASAVLEQHKSATRAENVTTRSAELQQAIYALPPAARLEQSLETETALCHHQDDVRTKELHAA